MRKVLQVNVVNPLSLQLLAWILQPLLAIYIVLFVLRIFLSWYPQLETDRFPFNLLVRMTEFVLKPTRKVIPPLGGVDMSPVVWVGIASLVRELLLGQQGILTMALQLT
ncbi:MAG: YggT family protein [Synechococcaceae cyanobacterium SM2_3_1]|nr:YggT family protein [Synechococcaceae cyanobacterium SM2_3_1]